jgi:hypothetical protein
VAPSVTRKRPATVFFAALFAIVLYFALFPYPLGKEIVALPSWAVRVPQPGDIAASGSPAGETRLARFQLGGLFGYVDASGRFAHVEKTLSQVALSDAGFVNFTRLGTDWIMYDARGARLLSFSGSGYPYLSPDTGRIFVVKSDLSGLAEIDRSGDTRWTRDFPALLTTLSVRGDYLLAGLLNGSLLFVDPQGSVIYQGAPPGLPRPSAGSRIPVLLGDAVTADGRRAASISGIDPQILTVFDRAGATLVQRAAVTLSSDFRREVRLSFSPDGRFLAFEGANNGGLYDPVGRRSASLPLQGQVAGIAYPGQGRLAAFVARASDGSQGGAPPGPADLLVVMPFVGPILRETIGAKELFVGSVDGELLLGLDGRLVRIDVVRL